MSKRTGSVEDHIANLLEHPEDVVMNDELIFLRHGFKRRNVAELRQSDDNRVLCQFNHEGILLRTLNAKPIDCLPWAFIFSMGGQDITLTNPRIILRPVGRTLRIWKIGSSEDKAITITVN